MSHTPGPWHIEGVGGIQMDGFRDGYFISAESARKVASVYPYGSKDRKQRWADANLIVAAPDLLAMLKRILDGCTQMTDGPEKTYLDISGVEECEIEEAIAKAEGKS